MSNLVEREEEQASSIIVLCYDADAADTSNKFSVCAIVLMTQVLQHRCLPADTVQQPYSVFRCDRSPATQSIDQLASHTTDLSAVSDVDRVMETGCPLPTLDLGPMLAPGHRPEAVDQLCQSVADCLRDTGCLVIRDPRVLAEDNMAFLNMMERYFAQSTAAKMKDSRPDLHFQVSTNLLPHLTFWKHAGSCCALHMHQDNKASYAVHFLACVLNVVVQSQA